MKKSIIKVRNYDTWEYADKPGDPVTHHVYPRTACEKKESFIEGDTEDAIFERFYKMNNSLRYCNGQWVEFKDPADQSAYSAWCAKLDEWREFHLYYGNGIVD